MKMQHGRLSLDLPDGWRDRSTLLFSGPPPTLPTQASARLPAPSISLSFVSTRGADPRQEARAILDDELAGLGQMNVGLEVMGIDDFDAELGPGVMSTHKLQLDGIPLLQCHAVLVAGTVGVRAVASTSEMDFESSRENLLSCLRSLRLDRGRSGTDRSEGGANGPSEARSAEVPEDRK